MEVMMVPFQWELGEAVFKGVAVIRNEAPRNVCDHGLKVKACTASSVLNDRKEDEDHRKRH